ncbi:hypothetical protein DASC09_052860 [Saccharomycopsis crataegensis]|uniref:Uncharacterized protein n=1 Tax=Saccharomycopsis crataegensis TaxID=43959 RepID=A0AAV5QTC6_9ASCO|nr:hypothetical protein DASC09_052860 [Saccharomycopsis crataegensis]
MAIAMVVIRFAPCFIESIKDIIDLLLPSNSILPTTGKNHLKKPTGREYQNNSIFDNSPSV